MRKSISLFILWLVLLSSFSNAKVLESYVSGEDISIVPYTGQSIVLDADANLVVLTSEPTGINILSVSSVGYVDDSISALPSVVTDHTLLSNIGTQTHAQLETAIGLNTAKVSADGLVTAHSDVTSAGSGIIISGAERTAIGTSTTTNGAQDTAIGLNTAKISFDSASSTKLGTIETSATADQTGAEIKILYEAEINAFTDALFTKLGTIETSAKDDLTGAEIKALYELIANAYTDTKDTKLTGIETGAQVTKIPVGGTTGQVLEKIDGTNYNTQWADSSGGGGGGSLLNLIIDPSFETGVTEGTCTTCTASSEATIVELTDLNTKSLKMAFSASAGDYTDTTTTSSQYTGVVGKASARCKTDQEGIEFCSMVDGAESACVAVSSGDVWDTYAVNSTMSSTSFGYKIVARNSISGNVYCDEIFAGSNPIEQVVTQGQSESAIFHGRGDADGMASTNTVIPYFLTETKNDISTLGTISNSATLGFSFTASRRVKVEMTINLATTTSAKWLGISKNSTELTTAIQLITGAHIVGLAYSDTADGNESITFTGVLEAGDILRPHLQTSTTLSSSEQVLSITATPQSNKAVMVSVDETDIGFIKAFGGTTTPTDYLYCDGTSYLRADYPSLFDKIGTAYGAVDSTHFNVPDLRGQFIRGQDDGTALDPDAGTRTAQNTGGNTGDNIGSEQSDMYDSHHHDFKHEGGSYASWSTYSGSNLDGSSPLGVTTVAGGGARGVQNEGGNETRPVNVNVRYYIKYRTNSAVIAVPVEENKANAVDLWGNGGEVVTANTEDIPFAGSGTGWSTGTYTTQYDNSNVVFSLSTFNTTSDAVNINVFINGVDKGVVHTGWTSTVHTGNFVASNMNAGDTIGFRYSATRTLSNTGTLHFLNIVETPTNPKVFLGNVTPTHFIQSPSAVKPVIYSATISATVTTCTISNTIGGAWLVDGGGSSAGHCVLDITSAGFSQPPNCTATVSDYWNSVGESFSIGFTAKTATTITANMNYYADNTTAGGVSNNQPMDIICHGVQ